MRAADSRQEPPLSLLTSFSVTRGTSGDNNVTQSHSHIVPPDIPPQIYCLITWALMAIILLQDLRLLFCSTITLGKHSSYGLGWGPTTFHRNLIFPRFMTRTNINSATFWSSTSKFITIKLLLQKLVNAEMCIYQFLKIKLKLLGLNIEQGHHGQEIVQTLTSGYFVEIIYNKIICEIFHF